MSLKDQITHWQKVADRDLAPFEKMIVARPYKYSKVWSTWSRVLKPVYAGTPLGWVELNLDFSPHAAVGLDAVFIRKNMTKMQQTDEFYEAVPDDVVKNIVAAIGSDLAKFVLYEDVWSRIDWDLYEKAAMTTLGGGIPLSKCAKV